MQAAVDEEEAADDNRAVQEVREHVLSAVLSAPVKSIAVWCGWPGLLRTRVG
jgi:hypothetical protein